MLKITMALREILLIHALCVHAPHARLNLITDSSTEAQPANFLANESSSETEAPQLLLLLFR